jgi:hypothetical protein
MKTIFLGIIAAFCLGVTWYVMDPCGFTGAINGFGPQTTAECRAFHAMIQRWGRN